MKLVEYHTFASDNTPVDGFAIMDNLQYEAWLRQWTFARNNCWGWFVGDHNEVQYQYESDTSYSVQDITLEEAKWLWDTFQFRLTWEEEDSLYYYKYFGDFPVFGYDFYCDFEAEEE